MACQSYWHCDDYWKHVPRNLDEVMFIKKGFGVAPEDVLDISISTLDGAANAAARIQEFCAEHSMDKKSSYYSALCVEEIAANIVQRGFNADKKTVWLRRGNETWR